MPHVFTASMYPFMGNYELVMDYNRLRRVTEFKCCQLSNSLVYSIRQLGEHRNIMIPKIILKYCIINFKGN